MSRSMSGPVETLSVSRSVSGSVSQSDQSKNEVFKRIQLTESNPRYTSVS